MKPYRFKHVPTGLYLDYKRHVHKLTTTGKIYTSRINGLNYTYSDEVYVKNYGQLPKSDFVREEVNIFAAV